MLNKLLTICQHKFLKYALALLAGLLLPFAFAPAGFYPLAILCPAILLSLWLNSSAKQVFWLGLIFGISFFGVGASWIYISINEFGNTAAPIAVFITALFVIALALFIAVQGYLLTRFFPYNTASKYYLAFPGGWALFEWLRSWVGSGFPWLFLGASQTNTFLKGYAPVFGEFGISFLVALCSALLVTAYIYGREHAHKSILGIMTIWIVGIVLVQIHWTKPSSVPLTVTLVQGNVPQQLKWTPNFLQPTIDRYIRLSQPYWGSALIVWPEAAIPALLEDVQGFINNLRTQAAEHYTSFIIGIPIADGFKYYNGMLLLNDNKQQVYYKRHLVPFGEYVPFERLLRGLIGFFDIPMSNFSPGPWHQAALHFSNIIIAPFICYEIAYQQEVLPEFPKANILVTISNDAWFGHSFASAQHLQIGQLRALETGRYHLFTANSGITAIIGPQGNIQASLPPYQIAVLTGKIQSMTGSTPLVWLGGKTILLGIGLLLLTAWGMQRKTKIN
jgi:apolipoprotein N-acyltransferase